MPNASYPVIGPAGSEQFHSNRWMDLLQYWYSDYVVDLQMQNITEKELIKEDYAPLYLTLWVMLFNQTLSNAYGTRLQQFH